MMYRTLVMLLLAALPVRAQIAVSANDATGILVDRVRVMVANAPPDTVTLHPLEVLRAALDPGVGPVHRHMHAGFVEKHETVDRDGADGPQERASPGLDVWAVHFLRPAPFFLTT